jgi:DtxR family Mn-dependent transcriptional regulator
MEAPLRNLIVFALCLSGAMALFWPRRGLWYRLRGHRTRGVRVLVEDALKHLYNQQSRGQAATLDSVGGALEIPAAQRVTLLDSMQAAGLIAMTDARLALTDKGERYALQVIRAHRLWERYLADETGVSPLDWHQHAEREEHALTTEQVDQLAQRLGNPRYDPHGDPIPLADGFVPDDADVMNLTELSVGEQGVVVHIEDEPHVVYAQLIALGIYLGMVVRVDASTDTRIMVNADGKAMAIAPIIASNLSIRRIEKPTRQHDSNRTLSALRPDETAQVIRLSPNCRGLERRRLMDMGIVPGTEISFERRGLTGGLCAYRVRGTVIALREEQTDMIAIEMDQGVAK